MSNSSFIYFDLGGVVIKDFSDSNKWQELTQGLGISDEKHQKFLDWWDEYGTDLSVGKHDIDDFLPQLEMATGLTFSPGYSLMQDFVDRFEQNQPIWPIIKQVHDEYPIGLLTNTYIRMLPAIYQADLMPDIEWDVVINSAELKIAKPDLKIYQIAQQKAGVPPNQILFIDNSQKNLKTPQDLGWHTFYYDSSNYAQATQDLVQYLKQEKAL